MTKELVSVAELQSGKTATGINFELDLGPYVDAAQVLLRTDRINRIRQWGGLGMLTVDAYEGDRTEYTPGVTGINFDGSATASAGGVLKRAQSERGELNGRKVNAYSRAFTQRDAVVLLNKPEVTSRIANKMANNNMTRERAWASELDRSLRRGLRQSARSHLFDLQENSSVNSATAMMAFTYAEDIAEIAQAMGPSMFFMGLQAISFCAMLKVGGADLKEWRPSLSPTSLQPDRLAVVGLLTATQKLVETEK